MVEGRKSKVEGRDALFAHLHLKTVWGGAAVAALPQFGVWGLGFGVSFIPAQWLNQSREKLRTEPACSW